MVPDPGFAPGSPRALALEASVSAISPIRIAS